LTGTESAFLRARQHEHQRLAVFPGHRLQEGLDREFQALARLQPHAPVGLPARLVFGIVLIWVGEQRADATGLG
jgi:hypothetical protein